VAYNFQTGNNKIKLLTEYESVTRHTTNMNDTLKRNTETAAKKIGWKYPTKQINNNNNDDNDDVPGGSKGKVYTAVVSPNNKCCLMMAYLLPKHVARTTNVQS
jgi:hypothetical protein